MSSLHHSGAHMNLSYWYFISKMSQNRMYLGAEQVSMLTKYNDMQISLLTTLESQQRINFLRSF